MPHLLQAGVSIIDRNQYSQRFFCLGCVPTDQWVLKPFVLRMVFWIYPTTSYASHNWVNPHPRWSGMGAKPSRSKTPYAWRPTLSGTPVYSSHTNFQLFYSKKDLGKRFMKANKIRRVKLLTFNTQESKSRPKAKYKLILKIVKVVKEDAWISTKNWRHAKRPRKKGSKNWFINK